MVVRVVGRQEGEKGGRQGRGVKSPRVFGEFEGFCVLFLLLRVLRLCTDESQRFGVGAEVT